MVSLPMPRSLMKVWRDTLRDQEGYGVGGIAEVADDRIDGYRWHADTSAVAEGVAEDFVKGDRHGDVAIAGGVAEEHVEGDRQADIVPSGAAPSRRLSRLTGRVRLPLGATSPRRSSTETGRLSAPLGAASPSRLSRLTGRVSAPLGARSLRIVLTLTERSKEPGSTGLGRRDIASADRGQLVGQGVAQPPKGVDLAAYGTISSVGEQPELRGNQAGAKGFRVAIEECVQDRAGPSSRSVSALE